MMRCYRRLLKISYNDHITIAEARREIQTAIGEYDEILTMVKKRNVRWFCHASRSSDSAKIVLQGTEEEVDRRRGEKTTILKSGQGCTMPT